MDPLVERAFQILNSEEEFPDELDPEVASTAVVELTEWLQVLNQDPSATEHTAIPEGLAAAIGAAFIAGFLANNQPTLAVPTAKQGVHIEFNINL